MSTTTSMELRLAFDVHARGAGRCCYVGRKVRAHPRERRAGHAQNRDDFVRLEEARCDANLTCVGFHVQRTTSGAFTAARSSAPG